MLLQTFGGKFLEMFGVTDFTSIIFPVILRPASFHQKYHAVFGRCGHKSVLPRIPLSKFVSELCAMRVALGINEYKLH